MSESRPNRFPTTRWSVVRRAGEGGTIASTALGELLGQYAGPLRTHLLLEKRLPPEQADDFLQAFISDKMIERDLSGRAVRERGRFRTFLLIALDRFVI